MYVDDILLIFDSKQSNIQMIQNEFSNIIQMIQNDFNNIHPKLQFTSETEGDLNLNYLDISIHRTPADMRTTIYRNPTFTDTIIPHTSNHPAHHKHVAIRFLFNRLHSYNLQQDEYNHELNTILILQNNAFPIKPHKPPFITKQD